MILFSVLFFVIAFITEPRKLNPLTLFLFEWIVIVFLAERHLFGLFETSEQTFSIIFLGTVMYVIGFYIMKIIYGIFKSKQIKFSRANFDLNLPVIKLLSIITIIYFSVDFINSLVYLMQGQSLNYIRQLAQKGALFSNPIMNAIRIIVTAPFSLALTSIVTANFFSKKRNNFLLISIILILIFRLFSDGGRSPIVYLAISFIISYFYSNNEEKIENKALATKKKFSIRIGRNQIIFLGIIIATLVSLYFITLSRSGDDSLRYTYYYFAMQPIMFEKWANYISSKGLIAYGMSSFNGILFPIFYLLANFIPSIGYLPTWRTVYDTIELLGTQWLVITNYGTTANSYVSIFWSLFFDFRLPGVVIGMMLVGLIVGYSYQKVLDNPTQRNIAIYSMIMIGVFYSFQQLITQNIYWMTGFLMLLFIAYKKER
ncbi:TPA: O-antigen polymerase [Streptococcus suis]